MTFSIRRSLTSRILDFSLGPQRLRITGSLVLRKGSRRMRRFAVTTGFLYPSLRQK